MPIPWAPPLGGEAATHWPSSAPAGFQAARERTVEKSTNIENGGVQSRENDCGT